MYQNYKTETVCFSFIVHVFLLCIDLISSRILYHVLVCHCTTCTRFALDFVTANNQKQSLESLENDVYYFEFMKKIILYQSDLVNNRINQDMVRHFVITYLFSI